jgi:hypothetical protein
MKLIYYMERYTFSSVYTLLLGFQITMLVTGFHTAGRHSIQIAALVHLTIVSFSVFESSHLLAKDSLSALGDFLTN